MKEWLCTVSRSKRSWSFHVEPSITRGHEAAVCLQTPGFCLQSLSSHLKGQAVTVSPCRRVHVYRDSPTNTLRNKLQGVSFLVQWHFMYWHEKRSDNDASSATSSQSIIGVVGQFLQANASRLWAQAQLEEIWCRIGLRAGRMHDIPSYRVRQTRNIGILQLVARSQRVGLGTSATLW
jgi:hypothetical protein